MSLPTKLIVGLTLLLAVIIVPSTKAECCVHSRTFKCCGLTSSHCNFFCCGCDGGCGEGCAFDLGTSLGTASGFVGSGLESVGRGLKYVKNVTHALGKRSTPSQSISKYENTVNAFESVDLNRDRVIDYDEGLAFLQNNKVSKRSPGKRLVKREDLIDFTEQFQQLDRNNDGVIEPHEFDPSLA